MTSAARPVPPSGFRAFSRAVERRVAQIRAHPLLNPAAAHEIWCEQRGGHDVDMDHRPHLDAAIDWLVRAQDVTPNGGIARGYSLVRNTHLDVRGWEPDYPETTGYIIPTLYAASVALRRPDLAARAEYAARWEIALQMPSGAVRGGTVSMRPPVPAAFNTGQVILGWLSAFHETSRGEFADAALRAARYLVRSMDPDGVWHRDCTPFADSSATLYNARTAWALAETGHRLRRGKFIDAAARSLRAVADAQHQNGWIPRCCLNDPERPLLHTLAYAIRGLIEGGRVLEDDRLMQSGARAAARIADAVAPSGWLPGRFTQEWNAAVPWSCLTGNAQMANNWMRLFEITHDPQWLIPVPSVITFLKKTQNRTTDDPGLKGGIKGAHPMTGEYGRLEVLSWATKYFADALMRSTRVATLTPPDTAGTLA